LGLILVCEAPLQISKIGFAAGNRDPNPMAAALAVGGAALALWQIANNCLGEMLLVEQRCDRIIGLSFDPPVF